MLKTDPSLKKHAVWIKLCLLNIISRGLVKLGYILNVILILMLSAYL